MTTAFTLDRAVRIMCPQVVSNLDKARGKKRREVSLWHELACCVLSSQVRYEIAVAVTHELRTGQVFTDICRGVSAKSIHVRIADILRAPVRVGKRDTRYRFPNERARQLAQTQRNLVGAGLTLTDVVYGVESDREKRRHLMRLVNGFGPKQASMFIRACGASYQLAVLDRHALTFMRLIGLAEHGELGAPFTMKKYESLEARFVDYASHIGYPAGYVDWAVWIVMRASAAIRT